MSKYAPKRDDGLSAYVVSRYTWGKTWEHIEWAESLRDAKSKYGWTRELHTSISVRRATSEDLEALS